MLKPSGQSVSVVLLLFAAVFFSPFPAAANTITITAPVDISGWNLSPLADQPQTQTGTLSVSVDPGSLSWEATASDADTTNTNGYMTTWNGSQYDPTIKLDHTISVASQVYEVTLPAGGKIAGGTGSTDVPITFKQTVTWTDMPGSYRIVVTFTASIIQ